MGLFDLNGKVAVVTGASRGLGRAIAVGLAGAGAGVLAADVIGVEGTVAEIKKLGREAVGVKVDVTRKKDVDNMVGKVVEKFGRLDILVNNAGILRTGAAEEMEENDWDAVIEVNLKGEFLCAQAAAKQMIKQKSGSIINLASIAGLQGYASGAAYSASKAGVILMTKTMAAEWGKHNVRVNAICPGVFETPMTKDLLKLKQFSDMIKASVPLGRNAVPKELAGTAVYLASDASSYVTGAAIVVDGGWTAGL